MHVILISLSLQKCCARVGRPKDQSEAPDCPAAADPDAKALINFSDPPGCCPTSMITDCWGELCTSNLPGNMHYRVVQTVKT